LFGVEEGEGEKEMNLQQIYEEYQKNPDIIFKRKIYDVPLKIITVRHVSDDNENDGICISSFSQEGVGESHIVFADNLGFPHPSIEDMLADDFEIVGENS
jgi:hypothetical protein